MPFSGVRISWLILARNSLLARFASSGRRLRASQFLAAREEQRARFRESAAQLPDLVVTRERFRDWLFVLQGAGAPNQMIDTGRDPFHKQDERRDPEKHSAERVQQLQDLESLFLFRSMGGVFRQKRLSSPMNSLTAARN